MRSKILYIILFHSLISFSTLLPVPSGHATDPAANRTLLEGTAQREALLWREGSRFVDPDNGNSSSTSRSVAITALSAAAEEQEAESSSSHCRRARRMCLPHAIPMSGAGVTGTLHSQPQGSGTALQVFPAGKKSQQPWRHFCPFLLYLCI